MLKLEPSLEELLKTVNDLNENSLNRLRPLPPSLKESQSKPLKDGFPDLTEDESGYVVNTQHLTVSYKGLVQS